MATIVGETDAPKSIAQGVIDFTDLPYLPKKWIEHTGEVTSDEWHLPHFVSYSFWIYCTHNIILSYILPLGHDIFGKSNLAIAILTPVSVVLAVSFSILLAEFCRRCSPRIWNLLNGGR